jgi:DNA-3-methyladenine glycosylase II
VQKLRFDFVPRRPYSLSRTLARLERFPERVDRFDGVTYRRLAFAGRTPFLLAVEQVGPPSGAVLDVTLSGRGAESPEARAEAARILDRVLGARVDVRRFYRSFRRDALLGPLIARHRGLRVAGRRTVWETLMQIVLSQQINLMLAHAMLAELAERLGRSARIDGETHFAFPLPAAVAGARLSELRRLRLSRAKAETLRRLGRAFESGELTEEGLAALTDEEAISRLTSIKGVGRWTAEFTLLRGLGRMDVFPAGDLGVVKYLARDMLGVEGVAREVDMRRFADRWRPHRGLALVYAYAELASRPGRV